jgi:predicted methyltransferase
LKPGDRIADFMPASGYFSRIFARVVGPNGRVYAFVPDEEIKHCDPSETSGGLALAYDKSYSNIVVLTGPVDAFRMPEQLDMVWTAQNYHDLYDPFMGPANLPVFDKAVFLALKHGGVFLVIDHVAELGSGTRDTNTLHRIDPAIIKRDLEAAGFQFAGESDVLRNPADMHTLRVFDPAIRGRTDQVVLKFVKP